MAAAARLLLPLLPLLSSIVAEALSVQPTAYPGNIYVLPDPGASAGGAPGPAPAPAPGPAAPAAAAAASSYQHHGSDWFGGMCRSRQRQSPVNFERLVAAPASGYMDYHYEPIAGAVPLQGVDGMLVVDLSQQEWGGTLFGGEMYMLDSIVFHGPAEHLIKSYRNPLELQLVHRSMRNPAQQLVIAVPIWCEKPLPKPVPNAPSAPAPKIPPSPNEIDFNADLQQFLTVQPPSANLATASLQLSGLDLSKFIETPGSPDSGNFFSYAGSDTRPPCVDNSMWFVRRSALVASNGQVAALASALYSLSAGAGSYRDIMPMNRRIVEIYRLRKTAMFALPVKRGLPWGGNPRTDSEFEAAKLAKNAREKAEHSAYYMEDFARRLRNSDRAFARGLWEPEQEVPPGGSDADRQIAYRRSVSRIRDIITGAARSAQRVVDKVFRGDATDVYHEVETLHAQAVELHGAPAPAPPPPPR